MVGRLTSAGGKARQKKTDPVHSAPGVVKGLPGELRDSLDIKDKQLSLLHSRLDTTEKHACAGTVCSSAFTQQPANKDHPQD